MRMLIVEDDLSLSNLLQEDLTDLGYAVDAAYSGEEAEEKYIGFFTYDLIVLDIGLPGKDGFEVCRSIRQRTITTPILMLTGRVDVDDKIAGLDCGADDYMVKPFVFEELCARVRALLRRPDNYLPPVLQTSNLSLNTSSRQAHYMDRTTELTNKEYAILEYFMRHPGQIVTRAILEQNVWNEDLDGSSNVIEVYIHKLRRKMGGEDNSIIRSVKGAGYRLQLD